MRKELWPAVNETYLWHGTSPKVLMDPKRRGRFSQVMKVNNGNVAPLTFLEIASQPAIPCWNPSQSWNPSQDESTVSYTKPRHQVDTQKEQEEHVAALVRSTYLPLATRDRRFPLPAELDVVKVFR